MSVSVPHDSPYWQPELERLKAVVEDYRGAGVLYLQVTIPATLSDGSSPEKWPVLLQLVELPVQHRAMIDFLVDQVTTKLPLP